MIIPSAARYFDTHCHLSFEAYEQDLHDVLGRAGDAGVEAIISPGVDIPTSAGAARLAREQDRIHAAAGIHPNHLHEALEQEMDEVARLLFEPGVIAVGESGMDLYRKHTPAALQRKGLEDHIELAGAMGMPLIVHSRKAEEQVLDSIPDAGGTPVVMHCYTGPVEIALRAAERGLWIGFAGPLTYRANQHLRDLVAGLPADRILVETDGPFLSPEPVRGGRNEPSNVVHVMEAARQARDADGEGLAQGVFDNSLRVFGLGRWRRTDLFYRIGSRLYVNLTGRCDNRCTFCIKDLRDGIGGYYLRHDGEPEESLLERGLDLASPDWFEELVFCGYGEPTMRPDLLAGLARKASRKGHKTRLNTNGLALGRLPREGVRSLVGLFDRVSVSLNASNSEAYRRICRPRDPNAWENLLRFINLCTDMGQSVSLTAVRGSGSNLRACGTLAEEMGLPFRIRG